MRFFFRSRQFKIILIVAAAVLLLGIITLISGRLSPQAQFADIITSPFKKVGTLIKNSFEELNDSWLKAEDLAKENEALKEELAELRDKLVDYETALNDNEFYKDFLEIKENNPDFVFCPALVTAKDPEDEFKGFTLDKGRHNGVELYDPVITHQGLVGYVTEVGFSTCKVTTILSPQLVCGAYASRTNDAGVVSGLRELGLENNTRLYNLSRTSTLAVGDTVVTSGSGIFPKRMVIGTVKNILSDPLTSSLYAVIEPSVDFDKLKNVMVLTSFDGQGEALGEIGE